MSLLSIAHRLRFAADGPYRIRNPEQFVRDLLDIVNAEPIDVVKEWAEHGRPPSPEEVAEFVAAGLNEMVRRRADDPEGAPRIALVDGSELTVNRGFFDRLREMDHTERMQATVAMFRAIRETGHRMMKGEESAPGEPSGDVPAEPEVPADVPPTDVPEDTPIIIHPELWHGKTKELLTGEQILVQDAGKEGGWNIFRSLEEAEDEYGPLPRKTKKGIEVKDLGTGEYRLVGRTKPAEPEPESAEPPAEAPETEPSPPPPAEKREPAPKMPQTAAPLVSQIQETLPLLQELWAFRADMAKQTDYDIQSWMVNRTVERFEKVLENFGIEVPPVGRIQKRPYQPSTDNRTVRRLADMLPEIMRYKKIFEQAEAGTIPVKTLSEWLDDFIDWHIDAEQVGAVAAEPEAVRTSSFEVLSHCCNGRMTNPSASLDGCAQIIASEVLRKQAIQLSKGNIRASKDGTITIDPGFTNCPVVRTVTRELESKQSDMGAMKRRLEEIGMLVTGGDTGQLNVYCLVRSRKDKNRTRMCQYFVDAHGGDGKFKIECAYKG